jgi:hypothetical protein
MSLFPDDDKLRKMLPIFKYLTQYFPKAHREVTKVCVVNNVRYNPDRAPTDIDWARSKSPDQLGSAFRHMAEAVVDGKVFEEVPKEVADVTGIDKVYVLAEAMWRLGAELELTIEREESRVVTPERSGWATGPTLAPGDKITIAPALTEEIARKERQKRQDRDAKKRQESY